MPEESSQPDNRVAAIETAVLALREGEAVSYGEIARRAGLPRRARLVGKVLRETERNLPWHRVVRADGRIAFPQGSREFHIQVQRLEAEGIKVLNGRIRFATEQDRERTLDEILWSGK